jgi:hypothetical protein
MIAAIHARKGGAGVVRPDIAPWLDSQSGVVGRLPRSPYVERWRVVDTASLVEFWPTREADHWLVGR